MIQLHLLFKIFAALALLHCAVINASKASKKLKAQLQNSMYSNFKGKKLFLLFLL